MIYNWFFTFWISTQCSSLPSLRDLEMTVCMCMYMCIMFVLKNLHLLSCLSQAIGEVSLFNILHDLASFHFFPPMILKKPASGVFCVPLPSLPPLWKPCLASCAESDLCKASRRTATPPSAAESLVLGTFYTFSNVLEWGRRRRALWSCGQGCSLQRCLEADGPSLVQRTEGLARWEVGTPSLGSSVDVPPVSCWGTRGRLRGGNGPHLQQMSLPWSHYVPGSGGARLHLCAALNACMANAAWVQGLAASWVSYRGLRFSCL